MPTKRTPAPKRKVAAHPRTPKTARQKAVEARRKIRDQASSAAKSKGAKTKTGTKVKRKVEAVGGYIARTALRGTSPKDLALFSAGMPLVNAASKVAKKITAKKTPAKKKPRAAAVARGSKSAKIKRTVASKRKGY